MVLLHMPSSPKTPRVRRYSNSLVITTATFWVTPMFSSDYFRLLAFAQEVQPENACDRSLGICVHFCVWYIDARD